MSDCERESLLGHQSAETVNVQIVRVEGGCCSYTRAEFSAAKFGFRHHNERAFYCSQWDLPPLVFLVYRLLAAAYATTVVVLSLTLFDHTKWSNTWLTYLTNWTYLLLTCHLLLAALITLMKTTSNHAWCRRRLPPLGVASHETADIPVYMKLSWLLFSIVSVGAVVVTSIYFAALYPQFHFKKGYINNEDINLHLMNSVLVVLELILAAYPVRLLHVIYPLIYGLVYVLFSVIYWAVDHRHVIYPKVLDWNHPGTTLVYLSGLTFVALPSIQLIWFLVYWFKLWLQRRHSTAILQGGVEI